MSESFKQKVEELVLQNPHMTYEEIAKQCTFSEYDIRRALGLLV